MSKSDDKQKPGGIFINSVVLFGIAKAAIRRCVKPDQDERSTDSYAPLVAIVFAAAAAEAFINELGILAAQLVEPRPPADPEPETIQTMASLLKEVESSRGSTELKFLVAKSSLSGQPYEKGCNPYQDFSCLMDLRNSLIHLKFDRIEMNHPTSFTLQKPSVVKRLRAKNILSIPDNNSEMITSWIEDVSTLKTARWACRACSEIVLDLCKSIPEGELRRETNLFYIESDAFTYIP